MFPVPSSVTVYSFHCLSFIVAQSLPILWAEYPHLDAAKHFFPFQSTQADAYGHSYVSSHALGLTVTFV